MSKLTLFFLVIPLTLLMLTACKNPPEETWNVVIHTHMIDVDGKLYSLEEAVSQGLISLEEAVIGIDHYRIKKSDLTWLIGALGDNEQVIYYLCAEIGPYRIYYRDSVHTNQALHKVYEDEKAVYGYYDFPNDWPYHIFEKDGTFYGIEDVLENGWIPIDLILEVIPLYKEEKPR